MQLAQIVTDPEGKELTERGTPLFPLSVHDSDMQAFVSHFVPWHWHDECEIVRVTRGSLLLELPASKVVLGEGDGAFLNAGTLHAMEPHAAGTCRMITVVFDPGIVGGQTSSIFQSRYVLPVTQREDAPALILRTETDWGRQAMQILMDLEAAYSEESFGYELRIRGFLSELWLIFVEHGAPGSGAPAAGSDPYIKQLLSYVHENYASDLTLEDVAASAGISCRTCSRSFRQQLQMSVFEYIQDYRIKKAAEKLLMTAEPVTDICFSCGFNDPSYFTRKFRAKTGMTPRAFRQTAGEAANAAGRTSSRTV